MPIGREPATRTDATKAIRETLSNESITALWSAFEGATESDYSIAPEAAWVGLEDAELVVTVPRIKGPAMRYATQLGKDIVLDARIFDGWKPPF